MIQESVIEITLFGTFGAFKQKRCAVSDSGFQFGIGGGIDGFPEFCFNGMLTVLALYGSRQFI